MKLVDLNDGVVISYYPNRMVCSSKKVIEQLKKYIQLSSYSTEAGGLLIGYKRGNHFEITNITYPYKEDIRSQVEFFGVNSFFLCLMHHTIKRLFCPPFFLSFQF